MNVNALSERSLALPRWVVVHSFYPLMAQNSEPSSSELNIAKKVVLVVCNNTSFPDFKRQLFILISCCLLSTLNICLNVIDKRFERSIFNLYPIILGIIAIVILVENMMGSELRMTQQNQRITNTPKSPTQLDQIMKLIQAKHRSPPL